VDTNHKSKKKPSDYVLVLRGAASCRGMAAYIRTRPSMHHRGIEGKGRRPRPKAADAELLECLDTLAHDGDGLAEAMRASPADTPRRARAVRTYLDLTHAVKEHFFFVADQADDWFPV